MRKILFGLAGALALGVGALASEPAQAQGFSITVGSPYGYGPAYGYPPPPPRYAPAYGYGRAAFGIGRVCASDGICEVAPPAPRCVIRRERQFDGFGWVSVRRRVCY